MMLKINKTIIEKYFVDHMLGKGFVTSRKLKPKLIVKVWFSKEDESYLAVEVDETNRIVKLINPDTLLCHFVSERERLLTEHDIQQDDAMCTALSSMTAGTFKSIIKLWSHNPNAFIKGVVKPFCFLSDPCYTFFRATFDPTNERKPTPTFDMILACSSNEKPFRCFVGSWFFYEADLQQYVYMEGKGGNGKGSIMQALVPYLGTAAVATNIPTYENRFFTHTLVGRRLAYLTESETPKFMTRGLWKQLTGGDRIAVEVKNGPAYDIKLQCKFFVASNKPPGLENEESNLRRIIYCKFFKEVPRIANFKKLLEQEAESFLNNCILDYQAACPNHEQIPCDQTLVKEIAANNDDDAIALLETYFDFAPDYQATASQVQMVLLDYGKGMYKPHFYDVLLRYRGVTKDRKNSGKVYYGLKRK